MYDTLKGTETMNISEIYFFLKRSRTIKRFLRLQNPLKLVS